jgi:hypothetical protein
VRKPPEPRDSEENFQPRHFLDLLERERRWCELLITAMFTRGELRKLDVKLRADDPVACALQNRARALRN